MKARRDEITGRLHTAKNHQRCRERSLEMETKSDPVALVDQMRKQNLSFKAAMAADRRRAAFKTSCE